MDVQKEISLRNAISYCIENNDVNTATNRIMEFIRDDRALQLLQTDVSISNYIDESPQTKTFKTKKEDYTDRGFYRK